MKKTLFLTAIIGAALCGTAFGETVKIDGTQNNLNLNDAAYAGMNLILNLTGGYFYGNGVNSVFSQNIQVGDGSENQGGIIGNNGWGNLVTFSGTITGSGQIKKTGAGTNLKHAFTGDVTGYTGDIVLGASANFFLCFGAVNDGTAATTQNSTATAGVSGTGDITFTSGNNNLVYNYASSAGPVYITNEIKKNNVTSKVQFLGGAAYTLTKSAAIDELTISNGSSITVGSGATLALQSDSTWTVTGETARTSGNGFGTGTVTKDFGTSLVNNGTITVNGSAATYDSGVVSSSGASKTYYINDASAAWDVTGATKLVVDTNTTDTPVALGNGVYNWSALDIKSGAVTTAHSNGTGFVQNGDITIGAGASLSVVGAHDAFGYDDNKCTRSVTLNGAEGAQAQLILAQTTDYSVTMKTNLIMNGNAAVTGEKGFNTFGGSISVIGKDNSIECIDLRENVTINVAEGGELTIGKAKLNSAGNKKLTLTGNGTTTAQGTFKDVDVQGGSLILNGATTMNSLAAAEGVELTIGADTTVTNAAELAVSALTMKAGSTLSIGQHEDSLVSVQTLTVEGAATLNANLELAAAATLHMDATLTMGCSVELGEGITLEGNLLASLLDGSTDSITLFTGADALTLGGVEYSHPLYGYEVFSNPELGNTPDKKYVVSYNGSDVKLTVIPEPATATLSLLALAALAARRRRH